MAEREWDGPPSMDGYLKYLNRRDDEPIDEAARLLRRANMGDHPVAQYSDHFWTELGLEESDALDRPRIARETGERLAQLRNEGFQGTDNEALFIARRDVVREASDAFEAERLRELSPDERREEELTGQQIAEMAQNNPPLDPEFVEFAKRLAKNYTRCQSR